MEMPGRVPATRRVAAADVSADEAHPKLGPAPTEAEAVRAPVATRSDISNFFQMQTALQWISSVPSDIMDACRGAA